MMAANAAAARHDRHPRSRRSRPGRFGGTDGHEHPAALGDSGVHHARRGCSERRGFWRRAPAVP